MMGAGRQAGLWVQSFGLSVLLHGTVFAYFLTPLLDFSRFQPAPAEPMAVTLSIMDLPPEVVEPTVQEPIEEALPEPEVIPEAEPEELAALVAEESEALAPVVAEEPETLAPVVPEDPEASAQVVPEEPEVLSPVATEISPLLPDEDTLAALAPLGASEVIGALAEVAEPVAPVQNVPEPVSEPVVEPAPEPVTETPAAPTEGALGTPGQVDEFIRRIRGQLALPCLVATPRRNAEGAVTMEMLAANEADILNFADDLLAGVSPAPERRPVLVDPRQCAALNFVREGTRYPAYPLALGLESDRLVSGGRLKGSLRNAAGRYVTLVLIDDNGVVQDLGGYLTFSGDTVSFDVPVRRDGPSRDTQQLLLAIATPGRPPELESMNGQLAQDFFAALRRSVARDAPLAMMPFSLQ
jgi:hypothetical protein